MMLDLDSVRLFVLSVDLGSLTRAAEAAGTVQPVVSQRIKALETRLGRRLLERTPRFVRPTHDGTVFLERARALLAAHDAAIAVDGEPSVHLVLGMSDHALGISFEAVLRRVCTALPANATIEVHLGLTHDIRGMFEAGRIDAAVIRREGGGSDGEVLGKTCLAGGRPIAGSGIPASRCRSSC